METLLPELRELLAFLLILGGAVGVHEMGHLTVAVAGGVRIVEAGLGLPPRLARLGRVRGTLVSLNLIPLGGFVLPAGEFGGTERGDFTARPRGVRAAVLAAGPAANLLAAFFVLTVAYVIGGPEEGLARVVAVSAGSPAEAAGLMAGDVVQWRQFRGPEGELSLGEMLRASAGRPVRLSIERDGAAIEVELTPRLVVPPGEGPAGFTTIAVIRPHDPAEAAARAGETMFLFLRATFEALTGDVPARMVGPLGLKQASDWAVRGAASWSSLFPLLYLAALINTGLALTNLLPIPALDGGRLALLAVEAVGVRLSPRLTKVLVGTSAAGLICLMAVLTVRDLVEPLM